MDEIENKEQLARQYLLGELDGLAREQVDELVIADPAFRDAVLMIEDELVEDYVAGRLTASDREKFIKNYLTTDRQLQKLSITKALSERADQYFAPHHLSNVSTRGETVSRLRAFLEELTRSRIRKLALVSFAILTLAVLVWLVVLLSPNNQRSTLLEELARVNSQPSSIDASQSALLTVTLSPILIRESQTARNFSIPASATVVQLRLNGVAGAYRGYRVVLRSDKGEVFTLSGLRAREGTSGGELDLKIPTKLLERQDYQLQLSGQTDSGQYETVADYTFRVSGTN